MKRIDVITLFPPMFDALQYGVVGRAFKQGKVTLHCWNPRDFAKGCHKTVDDRPYGGGPGMVMLFEPAHAALQALRQYNPGPLIYLNPQGVPLQQAQAAQWAEWDAVVLLCGRYEGIDERFIQQFVQIECSVGDYVVSGGELPAMLLIDALLRLQPGVLGDEASASQESFQDGLLDCPHYTRPQNILGVSVPPVLKTGDHQAISRWRLKQSIGRTWQRRPDLLKRRVLSTLEKSLLNEFMKEEQI